MDHKFNPYIYTLSTLSYLGYEISVCKEQGGIQSKHQFKRHVNRFIEEWMLIYFIFSLAENIGSVSIDPWQLQTKRKRRDLMHSCDTHSKQLKMYTSSQSSTNLPLHQIRLRTDLGRSVRATTVLDKCELILTLCWHKRAGEYWLITVL